MLKIKKAMGKPILDLLSIHIEISCGVMVVQVCLGGSIISACPGRVTLVVIVSLLLAPSKSSSLWVVIVGIFKVLGKLCGCYFRIDLIKINEKTSAKTYVHRKIIIVVGVVNGAFQARVGSWFRQTIGWGEPLEFLPC